MKILIAGTFCSGKTTLACQLHERLAEAMLVPDICRELLAAFPGINWSISELRDYLIVRQLLIEKQAQLVRQSRVLIVDSGIIGNLAHDRVLLDKWQDRTELIKALQHDRYDMIFVCNHLDVEIVGDGQRFTDASLRDRISQEILSAIHRLHYDYTMLSGSVEERFNKAVGLISCFGISYEHR